MSAGNRSKTPPRGGAVPVGIVRPPPERNAPFRDRRYGFVAIGPKLATTTAPAAAAC